MIYNPEYKTIFTKIAKGFNLPDDEKEQIMLICIWECETKFTTGNFEHFLKKTYINKLCKAVKQKSKLISIYDVPENKLFYIKSQIETDSLNIIEEKILYMKIWDCYTNKEIRTITGLSIESIKEIYKNALEKLK